MKKFVSLFALAMVVALSQVASAAPKVADNDKKEPTQGIPGAIPGATQQFPYIYSVKFICGIQSLPSNTPQFPPPQEPTVKPGNYATSVNIHNFYNIENFVIVKATVIGGTISPLSVITLKPNGAIAIDCTQIFKMLNGVVPGPFMEGFVEIGSRVRQSVAAVYTSQTCLNPSTTARCSQFGELSTSVVNQPYYR